MEACINKQDYGVINVIVPPCEDKSHVPRFMSLAIPHT